MKATLSLSFLLFPLLTPPSVSVAQNQQIPHLTSQMVGKSGYISLKFKDAWKYQQGDDMRWAEPNFDDSGWSNIAPEGLSAEAQYKQLCWQAKIGYIRWVLFIKNCIKRSI